MDNISHSIVGLAAGELVHRCLPQEPDPAHQRSRHRLLLIGCWLAANFPDLDIVFSPLLQKPLGYLLFHRGHTHTFVYAIAQALLLAGLLWALWPAARRVLHASAAARQGLVWVLVLGFGSHIGMDWLNSYGVHPFYPFYSHWFYGDLVFIVEPFFWIAFGVPLVMSVRRRPVRWLLLAALLGALVWFTLKSYLSFGSLAALLAAALMLATVELRAGERGKAGLAFGILTMATFIAVQAVASYQANRLVTQHIDRMEPGVRVLDVALTPFPSNPLCWTFVSMESNEADDLYRVRRGQLSLSPHILPVSACPARFSEIDESTIADSTIAFIDEEEGSLSWLRTVKTVNCHFEAWLRFARMPLLDQSHASDLRFGTGNNFTGINLRKFDAHQCSPLVPHWDFPRADLLKDD